MKLVCFVFLIIFLNPFISSAQQKKSISHADYDKWENLSGIEVSPEGDNLLYLQNPQQGDGNLIIHQIQTQQQVNIPRGAKAAFSPGGKFAVFHIEPPTALVRQAKVEKKKSDQMPKDSLGIMAFHSWDIAKYNNVHSYQLPREASDWLAFSIDFDLLVAEKKMMDPIEIRPNDSIPEPEETTDDDIMRITQTRKIKQLLIHNPVLGITHTFDEVEAYRVAENGKSVFFLQEPKSEDDTLKTKKLFAFDTNTQQLQLLDSAVGDFKQLSVSKNGELFAWLFSPDTTKVKGYDLFVHQSGRRAKTQGVTTATENMPEGFSVSEYRSLQFSDDNSRLYFGIAPRPVEEPKDTLLDEEKYSLDIWHWNDPLLQSQQRVNLKREQERTFESVFHLHSGKMVQLADESMPEITKDRFGNASKVMGTSVLPYLRETSWTGRTARDLFIVDVATGKRTKVVEGARANVVLSLYGNFILYYDEESQAWMACNMKDGSIKTLSSAIDVPIYNEENDVPATARPYGIAGWGLNDAFVLLYDRYDIWKVDPTGKADPVNITQGYGRENQIRFRYQNLDPEELHISDREITISAFNEKTKEDGYYQLNLRNNSLTRLIMEDASFTQLQKSRDQDVLVWRRGTFSVFPDLWTSNTDFSSPQKISNANPWMDEYWWGSVELVEWQDFNNQTLQGLLYLPEDFDPEKKYPMIVYFYERTSNNLHRHTIPTPSRSTINAAYCASNGYIVFMPDITYQIGFPGQSAYNAIVSGAHAMAERYPFINRDRMALQGQSWGGYQIAYLVTKTNMFRAAMAGAPVSNMVSAYGGIRWESGMVRQFQYEQTQSRIGGTLWEKPLHYIENSPVFFAQDIQTPLLIMHNDNDGAVPWYQGIELFSAMRRLDKPVWMLVYNREAHNLREWPARMDLSVRMYQFFDYYLKDKPAPRWLQEGIPYLEKGKSDGYELME